MKRLGIEKTVLQLGNRLRVVLTRGVKLLGVVVTIVTVDPQGPPLTRTTRLPTDLLLHLPLQTRMTLLLLRPATVREVTVDLDHELAQLSELERGSTLDLLRVVGDITTIIAVIENEEKGKGKERGRKKEIGVLGYEIDHLL